MLKFDLLVTDMDGTLLNDKSELTIETIETLIKAQEKGLMIVFASGRNYLTLNEFAKQIHMDKFGGYFIGANGQQLTNVKTGITEYKAFIESDMLICFNYAKDNDIEFIGVTDDTLYVYIPNTLMKRKLDFIERNNLDPTVLTAGTFGLIKKQNYQYINYISNASELPDRLNKIVLAEEPDTLSKHISKIRTNVNGLLESELVSPRWLELSPLGISKGDTLRSLADSLDIPLDRIIVFGDGENDLSMLRVVEHSYAVANAMDSVKLECNYITSSNIESGVARIVQDIFKV